MPAKHSNTAGIPAGVRLLALPLLTLVLLAAHSAFTTIRLDLAATTAQTEISFWGREQYQPLPRTVVRTGHTLEQLLQQAPAHPGYLALAARYSGWQAYWAEDAEDRKEFAQLAIKRQYSALESRPAHRHSWSKMVEYASRTTTGEAMRLLAMEREQALRFTP